MTSDQTAARMRSLRARDCLTLLDVATVCGCSDQTIRNWEHGVSPPTSTAIAAMAQLYHVSGDYLLGLSPYESGLAPDEWIVDLDAYEEGREPWSYKVPRRLRFVGYRELQQLDRDRPPTATPRSDGQ
jgi:transcriptional regulator with XRE-family HTH domain